jgi:hypothetical protein
MHNQNLFVASGIEAEFPDALNLFFVFPVTNEKNTIRTRRAITFRLLTGKRDRLAMATLEQ